MFSRIRPDCTKHWHHQKELDFPSTLRFIWTNSIRIERDIQKNLSWSGAKNSNKLCAPSHLVTWIPHCEEVKVLANFCNFNNIWKWLIAFWINLKKMLLCFHEVELKFFFKTSNWRKKDSWKTSSIFQYSILFCHVDIYILFISTSPKSLCNLEFVILCNHIITKTRLFKYINNFTTKNKWKFSDNKFWYFPYFSSKHRLWVLVRTAFIRRFYRVPIIYVLSRNKKNKVYPCKPQFYHIKVGFKGIKII